jgi:hypothetical protein
MINTIAHRLATAALLLSASLAPLPARAQSSDLAPVPASEAAYGTVPVPASSAPPPAAPAARPAATTAATAPAGSPNALDTSTYSKDDILDRAEGVFGKGAEGLAKLIERIVGDRGRPNAYITGSEGSGAIGVGLRYGAGELFHKVEGNYPVYWTGPSLGFDVGGNASKAFILVYDLNDANEIYHRYPAVEGNVYVIGGFTASVHKRYGVVLVPIRLGVGWRLGANVNYMKFTKKRDFLPF